MMRHSGHDAEIASATGGKARSERFGRVRRLDRHTHA